MNGLLLQTVRVREPERLVRFNHTGRNDMVRNSNDTAVLGRVFGEADDRPSAPPVAVISHAYWRKRFAGAPSAIGGVVSINGQTVTIVGVTPADFAGIERLGGDAPDVTVPLAFDALFAPPVRAGLRRMQQPTCWWLQLVGRLKSGVSMEPGSTRGTCSCST